MHRCKGRMNVIGDGRAEKERETAGESWRCQIWKAQKKYTKRLKKEWWSEMIRECEEASETV